jgi:hypothetical protein
LVRGGVAPALLTHRGQSWLTTTTAGTVPVFSVISLGDFPEFSKLFNVPWTVGAEFAWNASKRVQFFLEYAFTQASGKHNRTFSIAAPAVTFSGSFGDYRTHAGYLGARYYFESLCCFSCCGKITPYVGFKAGVAWQQRIQRSLDATLGGIATTIIPNSTYFISQAAVSGGLLVGLEWWFCRCWSIALQADFIATQGPRGRTNIPLGQTIGTTTFDNLFTGHSGWVVTFPVTLGLRWTF